ncbi:MAG: DUF1648 domain-containing protein [Coriobacteriales bacterium]|jgi:uncharacterized membrane protein|nr:DUF1648 domain-containing protein [Coriobacteriales bacterium]
MRFKQQKIVIVSCRTAVSERWLLLYPLVVLLSIISIILAWDSLPDPFPIHFNFDLVANGFMAKEPLSVVLFVGFQSITAAIFVGCHFLCKHIDADYISMPRKINPKNMPYARLLCSRCLLYIGVFATVMVGFIFLISITSSAIVGYFPLLIVAIVFAIIAAAVWLWRSLLKLA